MIEFTRVSKSFGAQRVLDDVSLRLGVGERVGVVGPNGAGKSTLFSLLTGDEMADRGEVVVPRHARIGHLRQQLHAHAHPEPLLEYTANAMPRLRAIHDEIEEVEKGLPNHSGPERQKLLHQVGELQHEYEDLGGYEMQSRAEAALSGLGFKEQEFTRPFNAFSGGWQMRAELARTLIAAPDILLLDEPSNYLDVPAVEWLQRFLAGFQGTLLLISHDRYLLRTLADVTVEIAGGRLVRYAGGFDYYTREREARFVQASAAQKNQERKREELQRFVNRFRAKSTKAAQVQSRVKMLEKMERVEVVAPVGSGAAIRIPPAPHSGREAIRLEQAGLTYDGERWVVRGVDLALQRGERVALVGYNGMGKTTLLRMLAGQHAPSEGRRVLGHHVVPGYQSQEFAETMDPEQSAYQVVRSADRDGDGKKVRQVLGGFGFSGDAVEKPCRVLSGGEKIRLAFARIFVNPPNLLLLDEPTTHLDIGGRRTLEEALCAYEGTVCLVSHDVTFIRAVATQIVAITPPGVTRYHGGYDYFREKTADAAAPAPAATSVRPAAIRPGRRMNQKRKRLLEKQVREAERAVEKLEGERDALLAQIASGGDVDFAGLNRKLTETQARIESETNAWEKAALALDGQ